MKTTIAINRVMKIMVTMVTMVIMVTIAMKTIVCLKPLGSGD